MRKLNEQKRWAALIVCAAVGIATLAHAEITIIAQTGDAAPDANGTFSSFSTTSAALNDAGQVAFLGTLVDTSGGTADDTGLFRGSGGALTQVARKGAAAPDANGEFSAFALPAINDAGQLAFYAQFSGTGGGSADNTGIYRGSGGDLLQIAREGAPPPEGNGTFSTFNVPSLNDLGQVAFKSALIGTTDNQGIYVSSGSSLTKIAREGDPAHDGDGVFSSAGIASDPAINDLGQVAFHADYTGNSGGTSDDTVVLRGTSSSDLADMAREGDSTPGGNGTLRGFGPVALNESGYVAFEVNNIQGAAGGGADDERIFRGSGGSLTEIQREGEPAPDSNGAFHSTTNTTISVNDSNRVVFNAFLRDTVNGLDDDKGIFMGSGGSLTQIVREGDPAPDGDGVISDFTAGALNNSDHVAFGADLIGTANNTGVFISDGVEVVRVVREGQALGGSIVASASFAVGGTNQGDEYTGLNDSGQVAFYARLGNNDRVIGLFTPDLHWRAAGSGYWSTDSNWTLGIEPDALYDVRIDPVGSVEVIGNSVNETVESLTVGSTGGGMATLLINYGGDVNSLGTVTINADGKIDVADGHVLSAPIVRITGVLTGGGMVDATLTNQTSGEVRVGAGEALHFTDNGAHSSSGRIEITGSTGAGGLAEIEFDGTLTNAANTGIVTMRAESAARFSGGLINDGSLAVSFAEASVFGDIANAATGQIVISGNSNATFYDDLANEGDVITSTGSTAVFFGSATGHGSFLGGGTNFFEGDLAPGSSPASVRFGGDVVLGPATKTHIELGGTRAGTEHDQLDVTGDLTIGGTLNVTLIDVGRGILIPQAGDVFDVLNFASISGDFTTMNLPALDVGLMWNVGFLKTTGELLSTFMGDINGDVGVGVTDLGLLANQWGTAGFGQFNADIIADGTVNVADLGALAANWGAVFEPSLSGAGAVPIPSAALSGLVLIVGPGLLKRRRPR